MTKRESWLKKHKLWIILVVVALLIILVLSGTKVALYVNFILGSDIVIKLNVDKEYLTLTRGQEEIITFEASVTTNPFCKSICNSYFEDLSKDTVIEQDELTIQPGISLKKTFTLTSERLGEGVELYRFNMDCHSVRTLLCHTTEQPNTRNVLITVNYQLSEEEKELKQELNNDLIFLSEQLNSLLTEQKILEAVLSQLNQTVIVPEFSSEIDRLKQNADDLNQEIISLQDIWDIQDYNLLKTEIINVQKSQQDNFIKSSDINKSIIEITSRYNKIISDFSSIKSKLDKLNKMDYTNETFSLLLNDSINKFNSVYNSIQLKSLIIDKEAFVKGISDDVNSVYNLFTEDNHNTAVINKLNLYTNYDSLCTLTNTCISHPSLIELSQDGQVDLNETCSNINDFNEQLIQLDNKNQKAFLNQSYPSDDFFWSNITQIIKNIKQNITNTYLELLPESGFNINIIKDNLISSELISTEEFPDYNLTLALIHELLKQKPAPCNFIDTTFHLIEEVNLDLITINTTIIETIEFELIEPKPLCCVSDECNNCCTTDNCFNDPSTYPVMFLHGHAVDKDLSAEYSLEGFNDIQNQLEKEGFLNAGSVTLYSIQDLPREIWKPLNIPLTFRASYYFDIFGHPENYIAVQTKSENIDTYAIRLKELIDSVLYKTNRPKVKIVAFSMGGLVVRRYIQIFGDNNVDRLIMIGTPNKGIVGRVSDYCPIIGDKLECRDMNSDSLFMNKLNRENLPDIPIHNIVGTGCIMKEGPGDGVVLENKALLEDATNYIIKGTCRTTVYPLHLDLRDIELYPEVYDIIKNSLN